MTGYTAALLDHGTMVLLFGWLAYHYGRSAEKRENRPWVLPGLALLLLYHGALLVNTLVEGPPPNMGKLMAETPTREELAAQISKTKILSLDDQTVRLSRGPKLTIPSSYKFIDLPKGAALCYCVGPGNEVIVVMFLGQSSDLVSAEQQTRKEALEKKRPWTWGPSRKLTLNGCDAVIMDFSNPSTTQKGYQVMATNGKYIYGLLINTPGSISRFTEAQFQKVIQSFAVGM
jgi:hypothetical protein